MTPNPQPKAIVLLSGGLDSAVTLALARHEGFEVHALSFRYGQRHASELACAQAVAARLGAADHRVMDLDLRAIGGSALTADIAVPKNRSVEARAVGIPVTYVPARNTVFLSLALGWAEVLGAGDIFIGVNAVDYSGYPDCRPEFVQAFQTVANLATKIGTDGCGGVRVHAPLVALSKADIVRRGLALGVDFGDTSSCYDPDPSGAACGACDSCVIRLDAFRTVGMEDPIRYQRGAS